MDKGEYLENLHVEFCPNKQCFSEPFRCLGQGRQDEDEHWVGQSDRQTDEMKLCGRTRSEMELTFVTVS